MKKVELDRRTAVRLDLPIERVREITAVFLATVADALTDQEVGTTVHLEGLGTLHVTPRKGVMGVAAHLKYYVAFRKSNSLTRALRDRFAKGGSRG